MILPNFVISPSGGNAKLRLVPSPDNERTKKMFFFHLRLVAEAVLQLPEGGQQPGAVSLELALLAAQAELHREPVALEKCLNEKFFKFKFCVGWESVVRWPASR